MARRSKNVRDISIENPDDPVRPDVSILGAVNPTFLWFCLAVLLIAGLAIFLRLIALDSDAFPRLSWSSALLTDEGFYIHNARNVVLFGTARTDAFNNMLIMPTLHAIQVAVFSFFGVGAIQARLISVAASLLTLPLFYAALRRASDTNVALVATAFLGLDHINLLYSRLALMDTPAAALMICSFYAFVRGLPSKNGADQDVAPDDWKIRNVELGWTFVCGATLGLAYATRGLTALAIPSYMAAVWYGTRFTPNRNSGQYLMAVLCGLGVSLILFVILWYQPHHTEIARVNRYYVGELLMPGSLSRLRLNLLTGFFDYQRGTVPYLVRHSPVQFCLACSAIAWAIATRAGRRPILQPSDGILMPRRTRAAFALLVGWMLIYCLFLCSVNYAPSRYNVLFYPAMAALSAYALIEAPRILGEIFDRKFAFAILGSLLICLVGQAARSRIALIEMRGMFALFCGIAIALYIGKALGRGRKRPVRQKHAHGSQPPEIWITGLLLWALVNGYWTGDWLLHLTYRQKAADQWLAANLEPGSTLFGAVAPGLCLNNHFRTINVIPNLSNDNGILEQFTPPRYIVMLDTGNWREHWWDEKYPQLTTPARRIHTFHRLLRPFFEIGLYSVDPPGSQKSPHLYLDRWQRTK